MHASDDSKPNTHEIHFWDSEYSSRNRKVCDFISSEKRYATNKITTINVSHTLFFSSIDTFNAAKKTQLATIIINHEICFHRKWHPFFFYILVCLVCISNLKKKHLATNATGVHIYKFKIRHKAEIDCVYWKMLEHE